MKKSKEAAVGRGILARPLDSLVFLLPLILFAETISVAHNERVIAFDLLRQFILLFGQVGMWAPALAVMAILLMTHAFSGEGWKVHWRAVALMYPEALLLTIPLLLLSTAVPMGAAPSISGGMFGHLALSISAGIYEELVFRLAFISLVVLIGTDLLKFQRSGVAIVAVTLSALLFAAHHHRPIGAEPFDLTSFLFRTLAGIYLATVFWLRGYGSAAGSHAAYNVVLCLSGAIAA